MRDDAPTETSLGFSWGEALIERQIYHKGHRLLMVCTPREYLEIRITPSGLIRFGKRGTKNAAKLFRAEWDQRNEGVGF